MQFNYKIKCFNIGSEPGTSDLKRYVHHLRSKSWVLDFVDEFSLKADKKTSLVCIVLEFSEFDATEILK